MNGAVVCDGPDAESGVGSQLWLTLSVSDSTKTGTWPMKVTASTTSADGYTLDNTTVVPIRLVATSTGGGNSGGNTGGGLPKTGPDVAGLALLALLLVAAGAGSVVAASGYDPRHRRRTPVLRR